MGIEEDERKLSVAAHINRLPAPHARRMHMHILHTPHTARTARTAHNDKHRKRMKE